MDVQIVILGWSARGLRCPDYEISFENGQGDIFPISLIQMPNGTGKTTTLELLRAVFTGNSTTDQWDASKIKEFQKDEEEVEGEFKVCFKCNNKRITIALKMDFIEDKVYFTTTIGAGKENGFKPPRECWEYFKEDFVKYFIFDGELAKHLLNPQYTDAGNLIAILYKVKYLEQIKEEISKYWIRIAQTASAKQEKGATQRKHVVDKLSKDLKMYEDRKEENEKQYRIKKEELEAIIKKYNLRLEEKQKYNQEYSDRDEKCKQAKLKVEGLTKHIIDENRSVYKLSSIMEKEIIEFKECLDKAKLPENTAKEFFEELAQEDICICGRPLDEEYREQIRSRARMYMGKDEMGMLYNIKSQISMLVDDDSDNYEEKYRSLIDQYKTAINEKVERNTELEELKQVMKLGDDEFQQADKKISELEASTHELANNLEKYDIGGECDIEECKRKLHEAEDNYAEVLEVLEIRKKIKILTDMLESVIIEFRKKIIKSVKEQTNILLREILPNNDIALEDLDKALKLKGKASGSEGETLSVGYAFLATLFNNTERQLPFIVDSPANAIDLAVRSKIAELIPKLANQFIAFTISSERDGFVTTIDKQMKENVQYITIFRKGDRELEDLVNRYNDKKESADGICIANKDFFDEFHKNKE